MRRRTQAREFALQILYQVDMTQGKASDILKEFWTHKESAEVGKEDEEIRGYAEKLVSGTIENLAQIDKTIVRYAENWAIERMAYVDRNILRLSTYEMLFMDEMPVKVAINEAVELAKRFGEEDSSKFVNGILDKIAKTECPPKNVADPTDP